MSEKKSFLLYISSFKQIRKLTQEQKGILLDAIMNFQEDIPLPEMDPIVDMCFGFIADDMKRDAEKYDEIVEKRRESGRKGGKAAQANQANARFGQANQANATSEKQANQANATSEKQANQANRAVNVDVDVDVNEDVNEDVNDDVDVDVNVDVDVPAETVDYTNTHIPTLKEIQEEVNEKKYRLPADSIDRFVSYNRSKGWRMDWKEALAKWAEREPVKKSPAGKFANFQQRDDDERKELERKIIAMQTGG